MGGGVCYFLEIFQTPPELMRTPRLLTLKKKYLIRTFLLLTYHIFNFSNAPVKLLYPHSPGQPRGQTKNVCDKEGRDTEY